MAARNWLWAVIILLFVPFGASADPSDLPALKKHLAHLKSIKSQIDRGLHTNDEQFWTELTKAFERGNLEWANRHRDRRESERRQNNPTWRTCATLTGSLLRLLNGAKSNAAERRHPGRGGVGRDPARLEQGYLRFAEAWERSRGICEREIAAIDNRPAEMARRLELLEQERIEDWHIPPPDLRAKHQLLDTTGFQRADFVSQVFARQFHLVPNFGSDNSSYLMITLRQLELGCPALRLDERKAELIAYSMRAALAQAPSEWARGRGLRANRPSLQNPLPGITGPAVLDTGLTLIYSQAAFDDIAILLKRYPCGSPILARYAENLFDFMWVARYRGLRSERMPPLDSPSGQRYLKIFDNCTRRAGRGAADEYCGCYISALADGQATDRILDALANHHFLGGAYIQGVRMHLKDGDALLNKCKDYSSQISSHHHNRRPVTTACLVDQKPHASGERECRFRSVPFTFTTIKKECRAEVASTTWGNDEIDCATGKKVVHDVNAGPKIWKSVYTFFDYEGEVDKDFVPPVPDFTKEQLPLAVRVISQDAVGALRQFQIISAGFGTLPSITDLNREGPEYKALENDIIQVAREKALLLICSFAHRDSNLVTSNTYWFKDTPAYVKSGGFEANAKTIPHPLLSVGPPRSECAPPKASTVKLEKPANVPVETPRSSLPLVGGWIGQLSCGQESPRFLMTVRGTDSSDLVAEVSREGAGPAAPGSAWKLELIGFYQEADRRVILAPSRWLGAPGKAMFGLEGILEADAATVTGKVVGKADCGQFSLRRNSR